MAKLRWSPILSAIEFLLQGRPDELLDVRVGDQPESARTQWGRVARNWLNREVLLPPERARIQAVWVDGHYRPAYNLDRERRDALRALIVPHREERPSTEQLQAALEGEGA